MSAVLCCAIFLTACAANQPTATDPPESRNADSGLNQTAKETPEESGSETSAWISGSAKSRFTGSYGMIYDETVYEENGLLAVPIGGHEELLDAASLEELIGADLVSALDEALVPLSRYTKASNVTYYEDGSICRGAELYYSEEGVPSKSVTIAFNSDHQVVCGCSYVSPDVAADYYCYDAYDAKFLDVPDQNWIGGTSVLLGHSEKAYFNEARKIEETDVFVASFSHNGMNYIVESAAMDETGFLHVVYAILGNHG